MAPDVLPLDIMSVNLNKNVVTIFFEGFKTLWKDVVVENISGSQLSLSYSNSIISSPCHAIDLIDTHGIKMFLFMLEMNTWNILKIQ